MAFVLREIFFSFIILSSQPSIQIDLNVQLLFFKSGWICLILTDTKFGKWDPRAEITDKWLSLFHPTTELGCDCSPVSLALNLPLENVLNLF